MIFLDVVARNHTYVASIASVHVCAHRDMAFHAPYPRRWKKRGAIQCLDCCAALLQTTRCRIACPPYSSTCARRALAASSVLLFYSLLSCHRARLIGLGLTLTLTELFYSLLPCHRGCLIMSCLIMSCLILSCHSMPCHVVPCHVDRRTCTSSPSSWRPTSTG